MDITQHFGQLCSICVRPCDHHAKAPESARKPGGVDDGEKHAEASMSGEVMPSAA
jgi:hypothetical protein